MCQEYRSEFSHCSKMPACLRFSLPSIHNILSQGLVGADQKKKGSVKGMLCMLCGDQSHMPISIGFLSGMNPMISSRNCTPQQSSVNCRDQCVHRECHCKIYRQVRMSFICMFKVLHYNSGWLSADLLQAVDLGLIPRLKHPCGCRKVSNVSVLAIPPQSAAA